MDQHTPQQRSFNMRQVKSKDTKPEKIIRKLLWNEGYRYRLHCKGLPGKPDIVFPGKRKAIFIHGCFWHKHCCSHFNWPKTNTDFWKEKINATVKRDKKNLDAMSRMGWKVLIIWECETKTTIKNDLLIKLEYFLNSQS